MSQQFLLRRFETVIYSCVVGGSPDLNTVIIAPTAVVSFYRQGVTAAMVGDLTAVSGGAGVSVAVTHTGNVELNDVVVVDGVPGTELVVIGVAVPNTMPPQPQPGNVIVQRVATGNVVIKGIDPNTPGAPRASRLILKSRRIKLYLDPLGTIELGAVVSPDADTGRLRGYVRARYFDYVIMGVWDEPRVHINAVGSWAMRG